MGMHGSLYLASDGGIFSLLPIPAENRDDPEKTVIEAFSGQSQSERPLMPVTYGPLLLEQRIHITITSVSAHRTANGFSAIVPVGGRRNLQMALRSGSSFRSPYPA